MWVFGDTKGLYRPTIYGCLGVYRGRLWYIGVCRDILRNYCVGGLEFSKDGISFFRGLQNEDSSV